jgi:uncharacterized delta-60 repeat protein
MENKVFLATAVCLLSILTCIAQPGSFDTTFGNGGKFFSGHGSWMGQILLQPDGKIVAVGSTNPAGPTDKFIVLRVNTDGTADTTFGGGVGAVYTVFGAKCGAEAVTIQSDGKLLVGGYTSNSTSNSGNLDFMITRYNIDGTLDQSFASGGIWTLPIASDQRVNTLAVLTDGKILAGGTGTGSGSLLLRLTVQGTLDTSFNTTGLMQTSQAVNQIILLENGEMFITGNGKIGKYSSDGILNTSFGVNGYSQPTSLPGIPNFKILSNGDIMGAGSTLNPTTYAEYIVMYNSNGTLKTSFGNNGMMLDSNLPTNILSQINEIEELNGTVYIGYSHGPSSNYDFRVKAFSTEGVPKQNFGTNGSSTFYMVNQQYHDYMQDIAVQPDGKLIVAGNTVGFGFCFARLHTEESLGLTQLVSYKSVIKVYPNPVTPTSKLSINLLYNSKLTVNMYDMKGQLVSILLDDINFSAGVAEVPLNMENISKGIYILEVLNGNYKIAVHKVVK